METKSRRWKRFAVGALVAGGLLAGAMGVLVAGKKSQEAKDAPQSVEKEIIIPVTVEKVTMRPIQRTVTVVGSLFGQEEINISPKVEGRVVKIYHDTSDRVKGGTKLLELDPRDYQLAVEEAKRALDLELAKIGLREMPVGTFDVTQLPAVVRAAAQERNAMSKRDRTRRLGGGSTQEDIEQTETDAIVARANYRQAILEAEATIASARYRYAAFETAQQRLRDTVILVPGSPDEEFVVTDRFVSQGSMVRTMPGDDSKMLKLIIDHQLKLKVTVPERYKSVIEPKQRVAIAVEGFANETFNGEVSRISPAIDRTSRAFSVEILIPNEKHRLSAGSFVKASIITNEHSQAVVVPEEAIVRYAGVTKVFAVRDGKAYQVPVKLGATLNESDGAYPRKWVEVEGNLPVGTVVVATGHTKLVEGSAVRIREPEVTK